MHYATIKECDVANGPGVRVSLFVSGCNHHCKGCFNEVAWNFEYGNEFTDETINKVLKDLDRDYIEGLSLLGGEPLEHANQKGLLPLIKKVKEKFPNKTIWCYTGYDLEKDIIENMAKTNPTTRELLKYIDVAVDGKFDEDQKSPKLRFRGSANQRILDVQETIKENKPVIIERLYEKEPVKIIKKVSL